MVGTRNEEIPVHTENIGEKIERRRWREKPFTTKQVISYLEWLWAEITKLQSIKYQNEYMNGCGGFARLIGFQGMNLSDLLAELNGFTNI